MPRITEKDTLGLSVPEKFIAVLAGQIQRKSWAGMESQYIITTIPASGTLDWETPETDLDVLYKKIDFKQFAALGKSIRKLPVESESNIESQENITLNNYLDFFKTSIDESDFDVDSRLVMPPMKKGHLKVKFKFLGKLPPRINFDPERD